MSLRYELLLGIDKEDLELNSKRKLLKRKKRLKDTSKQEEQLEESVKIKSTDADLSSIKTEPGPKKYNCHKCDYKTNNEEIFMII